MSLWAFCKEGRFVSFVFNSAFGSPQFVILLSSPFKSSDIFLTWHLDTSIASALGYLQIKSLEIIISIWQYVPYMLCLTMRYNKFYPKSSLPPNRNPSGMLVLAVWFPILRWAWPSRHALIITYHIIIIITVFVFPLVLFFYSYAIFCCSWYFFLKARNELNTENGTICPINGGVFLHFWCYT